MTTTLAVTRADPTVAEESARADSSSPPAGPPSKRAPHWLDNHTARRGLLFLVLLMQVTSAVGVYRLGEWAIAWYEGAALVLFLEVTQLLTRSIAADPRNGTWPKGSPIREFAGVLAGVTFACSLAINLTVLAWLDGAQAAPTLEAYRNEVRVAVGAIPIPLALLLGVLLVMMTAYQRKVIAGEEESARRAESAAAAERAESARRDEEWREESARREEQRRADQRRDEDRRREDSDGESSRGDEDSDGDSSPGDEDSDEDSDGDSSPPELTKKDRATAAVLTAWGRNEEPDCPAIDRDLRVSRGFTGKIRRALVTDGWGRGNVPERYRARTLHLA